jgi:hypothetical protein
MGRRSEQRIVISFNVVVRGSDLHGNEFVTTVETHDISCTGACLKGLNHLVEPGRKIEIQFEDQKALYRIQWVGSQDSPSAGHVGVRCLEPGRYIWGISPKEWEPDTYDPSKPQPITPPPVEVPPDHVGTSAWKGPDRRQFWRHACRIETHAAIDNGSISFPGVVTDISLGGCYVEMMSPLPVDTFVDLSLELVDATVQLSGRVRSSQTGLGMGVAFTGMSPANYEKLRKFAPPGAAAKQAAKEPATRPSPARQPDASSGRPNTRPYSAPGFDPIDLPATAEAFQAVVRVLFRKGLLTRAELLEELEKLKTSKL